MKSLKVLSISFSIILLASCANMNSVTNAPATSGVSKAFSGDYELVKAAVLSSMQSLNINIKKTKETSDGFLITFTKSISAFSWGEVGRVLVVKGDDSSEVFVHSEKRSKYQITGANSQDFANSIFSGVIEILNKG